MNQIIYVNPSHLNYISPLLKWRILDIDSLRRENLYVPRRNNFYRIIRDLEKKKVLEGFRDPYTKKKYVYLSPFGEGQFAFNENNPTAVSKETLNHDSRVSEIARAFLEYGWIHEAELEHQLNDKRNFRTKYKIIPDALFYGEKNGVGFKMALELELTRKNNQRIVEKARQYVASTYYQYVLYIFVRKELMEKFIELFQEVFTSEEMKRFMFFVASQILTKDGNLKEAEGVFKGEKIKLSCLFSSS